MKVFVHLAHGAGRQAWALRWQHTLGVNHDNLYGYDQAEQMGCTVHRSEDTPEGKYKRLLRMGLRRLLGFDMLHTWTNRRGILAADVVWTHTEMEFLAVLLLFRIHPKPHPKLIAQSVWLMDEWDRFSALRRQIYRALLSRADVLTFLSPLNRLKAQNTFTNRPTTFVCFGIWSNQDLYQPRTQVHKPLRILTVGNDRHRDWKTFIAAFRNDPRYVAKMVVSRNAPDLSLIDNISRERPKTNAELFAFFRWADVMVVPLSTNLHASGITAIEEAILFGIPVICSDAGGLRAYFTDKEVYFVPCRDPVALKEAADEFSRNSTLGHTMAARALVKVRESLNSFTYVHAHVKLSRQLLAGEPPNLDPEPIAQTSQGPSGDAFGV